MALIKSTILAQISGSINGTTFAHNQGGAYARNRSAVSNPNTGRQAQVRTAMTAMSKMWGQSLTQAQRDEWNAYGGALSVLNRLGDTISLSGIAAFNRVNLFRVGTLDLPAILNPPAGGAPAPGTEIPAYNDSVFINDGLEIQTQITTTASANGYSFTVWYSAPLSPGIRFYRGPYAGYVMQDGGATTSTIVHYPDMATTADVNRALKITMYETASGLPVWTVFTDPATVPTP